MVKNSGVIDKPFSQKSKEIAAARHLLGFSYGWRTGCNTRVMAQLGRFIWQLVGVLAT